MEAGLDGPWKRRGESQEATPLQSQARKIRKLAGTANDTGESGALVKAGPPATNSATAPAIAIATRRLPDDPLRPHTSRPPIHGKQLIRPKHVSEPSVPCIDVVECDSQRSLRDCNWATKTHIIIQLPRPTVADGKISQ